MEALITALSSFIIIITTTIISLKKQYVMVQLMKENKNDGMVHYKTNTNII